jgi:hypothetical protein
MGFTSFLRTIAALIAAGVVGLCLSRYALDFLRSRLKA